jgi:hypothetical protein
MRKGISQVNINKIQRIITENLKSQYSNKLQNLEEMHKFLDAFNQEKMNQDDKNHISIVSLQKEKSRT